MKAQEGFAMNPLSMRKLAFGIVCAFTVSAGLFAGAPTVQVSGTVTDGSGHGWPLFARVEFTSLSTDPVVAYSDPVTGAYTAALADGTTFTAAVTAVGPGYVPGGGPVVTAGAPLDANWTLSASALCNAPGYAAGTFGPAVFSESFDGGVIPPGWTVQTSSGEDWKVVPGADPSCPLPEANQTGGSGPYALANGFCAFFEDTYLVSPRSTCRRAETRRSAGPTTSSTAAAIRPKWRSRPTAARPGRASGELRGAPRVPARSSRTCPSRRATPTSS